MSLDSAKCSCGRRGQRVGGNCRKGPARVSWCLLEHRTSAPRLMPVSEAQVTRGSGRANGRKAGHLRNHWALGFTADPACTSDFQLVESVFPRGREVASSLCFPAFLALPEAGPPAMKPATCPPLLCGPCPGRAVCDVFVCLETHRGQLCQILFTPLASIQRQEPHALENGY